ncbi:NAD(P)-binding protein [Mycena chlorophos]|uniref:NAD(P)-binding protein n=1 Tax=Mycena chlorophos TaxID=658473 RepID=A0A8H6W7C9_MYCCL|nr:NAD(P)-binding protein [Mycena chlorophos]
MASQSLPRTTRALVIRKNPPYHDAIVAEQPVPPLKDGEVLVKISAAGFNRREYWIRKGLYPRIAFESTFGADGAGTVVSSSDKNDSLLGQRVFLTPMRGWESSTIGPESTFGTLGSSTHPPIGTFSEYVVVERKEVVPTPAHLTDEQAAAWPLAGLTAWRAMHLGGVKPGSTVLITGIGGGVALIALQFCAAMGANVYVTSSSPTKLSSAQELGARGGVLYTDGKWVQGLRERLGKDGIETGVNVVIDGAGNEILQTVSPVLAIGGRIVCYGMTANPTITLTMREVMRNQQVIGTSMGSRADMLAATKFIAEKKIVPVVAAVLPGLESAEKGFEMLDKGSQFGNIVIRVDGVTSKL